MIFPFLIFDEMISQPWFARIAVFKKGARDAIVWNVIG